MILINAFVSNLNYCNYLLYCIFKCVLEKLQKFRNFSSRVVIVAGKYKHITHLKRLHQLPIKFRVHYKVSIMAFKCLNGLASDYLCYLDCYRPSRCLRSRDKLMFSVPKIRNSMGERSYNYCGPFVWNKLPIKIVKHSSLNKFSKLLNTSYFNLAFN